MDILNNFTNQDYKKFELKTIVIKSNCLKSNPLKDSNIRYNQVLVPKVKSAHLPVVFILAGFAGNGSKYFNMRFHEDNFPQTIDRLVSEKKAPKAIYVFVDAMTFWGGSQFINSEGTGQYEDYIINELVVEIKNNFSVSTKPEHWCVMGGSSGGYGALHLASEQPQVFGCFAATAPDSFFQLSLLPEVYTALPILFKYDFSLKKVKQAIREGVFFKNKKAFSAINALGMGSCYAPKKRASEVYWPVDYGLGTLDQNIWDKWLSYDPVNFLPQRKFNLKKIKYKYLDVGCFDEYHLQFGSRMIKQVFKDSSISIDYEEFQGSHFDISKRRPEVLSWLNKKWV
jgi:hypothetical protein